MRIIEDRFENILINDKLSIALGTFDGVHIGHQEIIRNAVSKAKELNLKSAVFTFSKHPFAVLKPEKEISILTENKTKAEIIESLGVDYLFFIEFNKEFASIEPLDFLKALKSHLNAKVLVCGFNYSFGRFGRGDRQFLDEHKADLGLIVDVVEKVSFEGKNISSSIIRDKIKNGFIEDANELLGYKYFYSGKVIKGKQLGRELGFPTANIHIANNLAIKNGIYITRTYIDGIQYSSISNIGYSPTFENNGRLIESHILNFSGDLYGKNVKVEFLKFLRDEMKFNSLIELKEQVFNDIKSAQDYFKI